MTHYLDVADLLAVAGAATGGPPLVRDAGLLASAAARPQATAFGADAYPDDLHKAAALLHSLARNHALVDGNKRLAWAACWTFLDVNGHTLHADTSAAVELVVEVARGDLDDVGKIAERLAAL